MCKQRNAYYDNVITNSSVVLWWSLPQSLLARRVEFTSPRHWTNIMQHIWVPALALLVCLSCAHAVRTIVEHPPPHPTVATQYKRQWHGQEYPVRVPVTSSSSSHTHQWPPSSQWRGVSYGSASVTPATSDWRAGTAAPPPAAGAQQWALLVPVTYLPNAAATTAATATEHYHSHYAHDLGEGIDEIIAGSADEIRYARPVPRGGYEYRPRPAPRMRRRPRPRPAASPVIIRIHKHRITRD